jgi:hypothetical protein
MAWERRRHRLFYYRCYRDYTGRVRKQYIGSGPAAEEVARRDAAERAERAARRQAERELRQQFAAASGMLAAFGRDCDDLARSALAEAGLYQHHRGEWRRYGERRSKQA